MANAIYPKYKEAILQSAANSDMSSGTVKVALVDTGVTAYSAAHEFYSSISSAVVGTPQTIGTKTFTNGVFDGADVTYTAVSGATCEAVVIYIDTGTAGTSRLIAFIDTGVTNLPVTPNGGDITLTFNASGIFAL
jgi:predicted aspartyl protease